MAGAGHDAGEGRAGSNDPQARRAPPVRKSLGQHFLSDRNILARIVDALDVHATDTVVEIGPGRGALTDILRERAKRVVAVEYDRSLAALLVERYGAESNVRVVQADVLQTDLGAAAGGDYLLAGNVPYYITTPILFHALKPPRARRAVYLVQKEVADRMTASPGSREYGALSVNVQALASAEKIFRVPAGAFHPPPKVDSAVVRVIPRDDPVVTPQEERGFRELVQAAFGLRRKQMRRVVRELEPMSAEAAETLLHAIAVPAEARPETLSPIQFAALYRRLAAS
ncbi:MAG TPA: 16S rRNA (adenine(1518)-N(6)/adenine(1519)-N(6))-dimethyltransferase RsmA [Gemmatimonadaceae bacterium]|nr:16S rRNA (adenine(1518)-N(6)/adenine(1519)-N(6))-dimethyltransferase RsmA [Gemmatimonadaceae bacterium]